MNFVNTLIGKPPKNGFSADLVNYSASHSCNNSLGECLSISTHLYTSKDTVNIHDSLLFGSRRWVSPPMKVKVKVAQSCPTLCNLNSPGQNTGMGSLSLLQGIFPTQGGDTDQWQRVFGGYTSQLPHLSTGIVLRYGLHIPRVPGQNTLQLLKVTTSLITTGLFPFLSCFLTPLPVFPGVISQKYHLHFWDFSSGKQNKLIPFSLISWDS